MKRLLILLFSVSVFFAHGQTRPNNFTQVATPYEWNWGRFKYGFRVALDTLPTADTGSIALKNGVWYGKKSGVWSVFDGGSGSADSSLFATRYWVNSNFQPLGSYVTSSFLSTNHYTKTQINSFFGGTTGISGYNKANWDAVYSAYAAVQALSPAGWATQSALVDSAAALRAIAGGGGGSGDMTKAVYDPGNSGVVDNSEALGGHAASYFQPALSGTGIVKSVGGTISYITDFSTDWNTAYGWGNHAVAGYLHAPDTANHWVNNFYKRSDSVFFKKGSTEYFAFKDSSGGGVGDTTNISNFSVKVRSLFSGTAPIVYSNGNFSLSSLDSSKVTGLHTESYYNTKFALIGSTGTPSVDTPFVLTVPPSSPTWNTDTTDQAKITLDRDTTLYLTNLVSGVPSSGIIYVTQDGTGGHALTLPGRKSQNFELELDPNGYSVLGYTYDGTNVFWTAERGQPLPQLSTPSGFTATAASSSQINLSWSDVANDVGYNIYRHTSNTFGSATLINTTAANATSYNNTGLTAATTYYYWLEAIGDGINYSNSNTTTSSATTSASFSYLTWPYKVGMTENTNGLIGTGGGTGFVDHVARSAETLTDGYYFEFTANDSSNLKIFGLTPLTSPSGEDYLTMPLRLGVWAGGDIYIGVNGSWGSVIGTYVVGDVIRITRTGNSYTITKNGTPIGSTYTPTDTSNLYGMLTVAADVLTSNIKKGQ